MTFATGSVYTIINPLKKNEVQFSLLVMEYAIFEKITDFHGLYRF
jgi:hypothetical protein